MQPGGGYEQLSVVAEDGGQGPGSRGHPLYVCPAERQRDFKKLADEFFGPESLIHALQAMSRAPDTHRRGVPSGDV